jgi:hypothetical protein
VLSLIFQVLTSAGLLLNKGPFFNYVDQILPDIDYLFSPGLTLAKEFVHCLRENLHTIDIFSTTYLPRLVNTIKEGPLDVNNATYIKLDTYIF